MHRPRGKNFNTNKSEPSMTPPIQSLNDIANRVSRGLSTMLPSGNPTDECASPGRTIVGLQIDTRQRVALDEDGLLNDFIGTAHVIVREQSGRCGWFGDARSRYFT